MLDLNGEFEILISLISALLSQDKPLYMKKIYSILFISFFCIYAQAAVRTVNNNNPSPGQYTTLQAAIDAAASGDTIYVSGTFFNYGSVNVNKTLTIIGTGHNPQKQMTLTSQMDWIYFNNAAAKKSRIIGMNLYGIYPTANNVDSIYIERCKIRYRVQLSAVSGLDYWFIDGNYFENNDGTSNVYLGNNTFNWIVFRNNVFNGPLQEMNYNANGNIYVMNNLFLYSGSCFLGSNYYLFMYNNIFYRASPSPSTVGCTWQNNLSFQCANNTFPAGVSNTGNQPNVDPKFVSFPLAGAYFSYTHNYDLQPTSPALNAGNDGKDIGLTGGDVYFDKYGIPSIPQIREFNITSNNNIAPGGSLQIKIKSTIKK